MLNERTIFYVVGTLLLAAIIGIVAKPKTSIAWRSYAFTGVGFVVAAAAGSIVIGGADPREMIDILTFSPDIPSSAFGFSLGISLGYVMIISGVIVRLRQALN